LEYASGFGPEVFRVTRINWKSLLWETRGYLGIDDPDALRVRLTEESGKRENHAEQTPEEPDPSGGDPEGKTDEEPGPETPDTPTPADGVAHIGETAYAPTLTARDWWVTWILDGHKRKRPVAPWQTGHAYPVKWSEGLAEEERPETTFEEARRWAEFRLSDAGLSLPEDAESDTLRLGIILPADRPPIEERVTLIDWDDVRDPDTEEIHPVAAAFIQEYGGYVEVSRSGEGLHQFVTGGLRKRGKFIAPIAEEPFIGDDLPQVEIYDGGRHVAMTGEHVVGTDTDAVEGQGLIDTIVSEYADAEKDAGHRTYDPDTGKHTEPDGERGGGEHVPDPDTGDYTGPPVEELRKTKPEDRSFVYHAVVETFYRGGGNADGYANIQNWRLEGFAAALGEREGLDPEEIIADLKGRYLDDTGVTCGCVHRTPERIEYGYERARTGRLEAPSRETLGEYGVLPVVEPVAVLPQSVRDLSHATTGFDWRHTARQGSDTLTLDDARERTTDAVADAYQYGDRVLIRALPIMGKSYSAIKAAARTGETVTVLTVRGRKEQYGQFKDWCEKFGLSYYQLPSFTHDCDTANGEHGQEWADTVGEWYSRGATPKEIHKNAEYELGRPLPCQAHDGQQCPYSSKWDFDPDDFDVLIGHPTHAYRENKVVSGRTVVFDEFPGAFETRLGTNLQGAVSYWLQANDGVPFDDYTDLLENRSDETRRADALLWFEEHGVEPDELSVFDDPNAHAAAPIAVFTILAADDLGNGFEYADIDGVGTGVRNRENDGISILQPPDLSYASSVVALDGTPTQDMWELSLGERLNHRAVLQDGEREEYLRDALNLNIVRSSEHVKPYNSKGHVNTRNDAALLKEMKEAYGERPGLITSATAINEYEDAGVLDLVDGSRHYGNVLGSNEFKEKRVGAVIGSNHYGDDFIQKWGAYAGEYVPGGDEARDGNEKKGADLSYGEFGDKVLTHMREHDTLQAVMRFGRDGNGAVVYTHTDTLPEWVPIAGETRVTKTWSDGMRSVKSALEDLEAATTEAIVEHPEVSLSRQQVFTHLNRLRERGVLDREQDAEDGRRYVWKDDGLHRVNDHGEVELDPVELDELDDDEVRKVARSSIYTWNFTNPDDTDAVESGYAGPTGATPKTDADAGGDRPPDPAD
jgi:hypothetical protein